GMLVADYLKGAEPVTDYLSSVQARRDLYNGFNLIAGDLTTVSYGSNRTPGPCRLDAGIFGVSNHSLDTPWPKLERGKAGLRRLLSGHRALDIEALFALLADRRIPPDADLPDTGVGIEWERLLSPIFIESAHYGTRSSTVLLVDRAGRLTFVERSFEPGQEKFETRRFHIALGRGVRAPTP
ncbi:MAG: NRDE family protein, partial [Gammaproteobacteria bacterium]